MKTSYTFEDDKLSLSTMVQDDHVLTTVHGSDVYSLTDKKSGRMSLVAFNNKIAANRFFAANNGYYAQKIL